MEDSVSEGARLLAGQRRRIEKTCTECGLPMVGISTRRYCSDACRARAFRKRHPELANKQEARAGGKG